ncbi:hypothetical protein [Actinomadura rayongensis]|uniref:Uncharacterized protein n=1 Tax=Actinomadura rayongensis TaxID=1429076 RepID=A0A6I4W1P2_9ACTN|nr:hypothetical protein [Actinomadura rayongensis]MXQ63403.1 hypothetical protein [Actinomadura rayongensis]
MSTDTDAGMFFAEAGPDLYAQNAFRVTGLAVTATARDIRKHSEQQRVQARLGTASGSGSPLLPLPEPPDQNAVEEALQRLRDPVRRLEDEFFWFWPMDRSGRDDALDALRRGDFAAAEAAWRAADGGRAAAVAVHNLAVLAHARALDARRGGPFDDEQGRLWTAAYASWRQLLTEATFWPLLDARIADLNDPRLANVTSADLRRDLPGALLSISARLAAESARDGQRRTAAAHIGIARRSGFDGAVLDDAVRAAVAPDTALVRSLADNALRAAQADVSRGAEEARRLLDQAEPVLHGLVELLPADHPLLQGARDDVAGSAMRCVVMHVNDTKDYGTAVALLERARAGAATDATRTRIEENLTTVRNNLTYSRCWFCKERPYDEPSTFKQGMHSNVQRQYVAGGTRTTWQKKTLEIPRCAACKARHDNNKRTSLGFGCGGAVVLLGLAVAFFASGIPLGGVIMIGVAIAAGFLGTHFSGKYGIPNEEHRTIEEFEPVREHIRAGWKYGEKPPGVS